MGLPTEFTDSLLKTQQLHMFSAGMLLRLPVQGQVSSLVNSSPAGHSKVCGCSEDGIRTRKLMGIKQRSVPRSRMLQNRRLQLAVVPLRPALGSKGPCISLSSRPYVVTNCLQKKKKKKSKPTKQHMACSLFDLVLLGQWSDYVLSCSHVFLNRQTKLLGSFQIQLNKGQWSVNEDQ